MIVAKTHRAAGGACLMALLILQDAAAADSGGIEEIVVTAQKRSERVQDIPIALSVLSGQDLVDKSIGNVDDLAAQLPNLLTVLPFGPQEPQFSLRGVTGTDYSPNQSSPIALYVDGVFKSVGALQALTLFDTEDLSVLRGPQGTLQGRNATGGAILINSVKPGFDSDGYLMAGLGNYGRYETQGAVDRVLIDDKLAMRFAYTYTYVPGYFEDPVPDARSKWLSGVNDGAARLSLLYRADDFDVLLRLFKSRSNPTNYGEYSKDIGPGGLGVPVGYLAYLNIPSNEYGPTGVTRQGLKFFQTATDNVHSRLIANQGVSLEIGWQLTPELKLTSVSGYDNGDWRTNEDDDGSIANVDRAIYTSSVSSEQEELRLTSSFSGPENFILGTLAGTEALFFSNQSQWDNYIPAILRDANGNPVNVCLATQLIACQQDIQFHQQRQDLAVYVNNNLTLADGLIFTAGARYTDDSVRVSNYQTTLGWIDPTGREKSPTVTLPATEARAADHKWIGKASLDKHLDQDTLVYASWSLGFRGSAFNASAFTPQGVTIVKPETLMDYETGAKADFLGHRLRVNLSAFYYVYRNQQFATIDPVTGADVEYNLPKIDSTGGEWEITVKPVDDLLIRFNGGYNFAVYQGGVVNDLPVKGNRVQEAPRWSFGGSVDWHMLDRDWIRLDWLVDGYGITRQNFDANNDSYTAAGPYAIFGTRLNAELPAYDTTLAFWVRNLFNREYYTVMYNSQPWTNFTFAERGTPRTFGLSATWRF